MNEKHIRPDDAASGALRGETPRQNPVQPLEIMSSPRGDIRHAAAVRAGRWIFASGLLATEGMDGIAADIARPALPRSGLPKAQREAARLFDRLEAHLAAAGSRLDQVARVDQFYRSARSVDPYHTIRKARFGEYLPASTSILVDDLLFPEAEIDLQVIAAVPSGEFRAVPLHPSGAYVPAESAHSPAVRLGDFVFVAGQLARGPTGELAPESCVPRDQLWKGTQIKREAEYVIRQRMEPVLREAGASLDGVVKAQVYLSDIDDLPAFREVWQSCFSPGRQPATSYVPTSRPGFGTVGTNVEINVIALVDAAASRKHSVTAPVFTGFDGDTVAVKADDLLFVSGLMAVDEAGVVANARPDPRQPYFGSSIAAQTNFILDRLDEVCAAGGTSLDHLVRVQQFHTDLNEFQGAYDVWRDWLGGRAVPFSAVQVPAPLAAPGCSVLFDAWVYVPTMEEQR